MARHVFHWKHGWIPLDHEAISHGGHRSQATGPIKGDRRPPAGHPIRTTRPPEIANTFIRPICAANTGQSNVRPTTLVSPTMGLLSLTPPA
jgi:hypothetical protein